MMTTMFVDPAKRAFVGSLGSPFVYNIVGEVEIIGDVYVETFGKLLSVREVCGIEILFYHSCSNKKGTIQVIDEDIAMNMFGSMKNSRSNAISLVGEKLVVCHWTILAREVFVVL